MKYTVVWTRDASDQLATIWVDAAGRGDVTAAADELDRLLKHQAQRLGEQLDEDTRVVILAPLVLSFEVNEQDRRVTVIAVRYRP